MASRVAKRGAGGRPRRSPRPLSRVAAGPAERSHSPSMSPRVSSSPSSVRVSMVSMLFISALSIAGSAAARPSEGAAAAATPKGRLTLPQPGGVASAPAPSAGHPRRRHLGPASTHSAQSTCGESAAARAPHGWLSMRPGLRRPISEQSGSWCDGASAISSFPLDADARRSLPLPARLPGLNMLIRRREVPELPQAEI